MWIFSNKMSTKSGLLKKSNHEQITATVNFYSFQMNRKGKGPWVASIEVLDKLQCPLIHIVGLNYSFACFEDFSSQEGSPQSILLIALLANTLF